MSIPIEKEEDVKEVKIIGKILRVEEISTDNGSINALGIKFISIGNEDLLLVKNFLKEKYRLDKKTKEAGSKTDVLKDENGVEVQGLEAEITPIDMPNMSFFQSLCLREDSFHRICEVDLKSGSLDFVVLCIFPHDITCNKTYIITLRSDCNSLLYHMNYRYYQLNGF